MTETLIDTIDVSTSLQTHSAPFADLVSPGRGLNPYAAAG